MQHALRTPDANSRTRETLAHPRLVQRKCGCGGTCGSCSDEEKKKKVQRRALGETSPQIPKSIESILGSPGRTLDTDTRATMESRFGRSFAGVRVHTDSHAAASAREIDAAAYTSGTHIVFGAGRFEPQTAQGRRLLAHELAHVVQQRSGTAMPSGIGPADDAHERAADRIADAVVAQGPVFAPPPSIVPVAERFVRRKREDDVPATVATEPPRFIVDDKETPAPGQMRRGEFVDELDAAVCATSSEEMGHLGRSTAGCPMLEQWRPRIRAMGARELEVSLRRWIEGDTAVRTARDYIPRVAQKLAQSIRTWGSTGQILGIPSDLMSLLGGGKIRVGVGSLIRGAVGRLFRKARNGGPATVTGVALDAGGGQPLAGNVASRMGIAFGRDFSDVRIHTDAEASVAASRMNARAFTIGRDIAFAGGEYAPGTLIGDALLAHELAHVVQQGKVQQDGPQTDDANVMQRNDRVTGALEEDADVAAVYAVTSLWPEVRRFGVGLRGNAMPRLRSSLRLQRCDASPTELQDYLKLLDRTNAIEDHGDSDDKARQITGEWSKGSTAYILTVRRKILLIKEMLDGDFSSSDQKQVLNLLERSESSDLEQILGASGGIPHETLLGQFKSWKKELWRFYMRRYPSAYPKEVSNAIFFADEAPEPQAPDLALLAGATPSSTPYSVVQFGDDLPETTQPLKVATGHRTSKISKDEAQTWVTEVYGKLITKEQTERVSKTSVHYEPNDTYEFVDFLYACVASKERRTKEDREKAERDCRAEEPSTAAFYSREHDQISVRVERETPETMLHEVIHAFAHERVDELGHFALEGLTELLTRRVTLQHKLAKDEKRLLIGGHYDPAYDAIQELAIVVGEDLLARVHFQGAVTELCNAMGKAKFDAWNKAMENRGGAQEATDILRGVKAVPATAETCK